MRMRFGGLRNAFRPRLSRSNHPYAAIAEIYDSIMDHVDYSTWADYLTSLFRRFHPRVKTVFETACGTGSLALHLHAQGYSCTGMDRSPEMLKIAALKFRETGLPLRLFAANMTAIPLKKRFDAVICVYDSINYLLEPDDFRKALLEAAAITENDGLFIFDVCTVKNSELFFKESSMTDFVGDLEYERICRFDSSRRIQENRFIISCAGKSPITETHLQKIYLLDEIGRMIRESPFTEVGRYDDMSFRPGSESSERVHFVLKR
jgi:ubiquinone/menaquinone biosynthesis C-methylase UbiE